MVMKKTGFLLLYFQIATDQTEPIRTHAGGILTEISIFILSRQEMFNSVSFRFYLESIITLE